MFLVSILSCIILLAVVTYELVFTIVGHYMCPYCVFLSVLLSKWCRSQQGFYFIRMWMSFTDLSFSGFHHLAVYWLPWEKCGSARQSKATIVLVFNMCGSAKSAFEPLQSGAGTELVLFILCRHLSHPNSLLLYLPTFHWQLFQSAIVRNALINKIEAPL